MERYINPFTDFGRCAGAIKKLFGEEANKDLLTDFLNTLLPDRGPIADLALIKTEQLGGTPTDRKAIFDLYCQNEKGEQFIFDLKYYRALKNVINTAIKDGFQQEKEQVALKAIGQGLLNETIVVLTDLTMAQTKSLRRTGRNADTPL